jgi:uroporphyrin-III C-methyltransferase
MTGTVYIVGAGPGDPELITVKGLKALQQADVVIYDRLAPPELLDEAPAHAERINAGKAQHDHTLKQPEINALLVEKAQQGKTVVRLKGGDPFVFGRGAEEALCCHAAGVPFVVIPGVTSAVAVPAAAGIPVTHRDFASVFTVITGHENPDKPESALDFDAIVAAAKAGTLVMLMGATYLEKLVERLLHAGLAPDAPAACIEWGTTPRQRVVQTTLGDLVREVRAAGLGSPAITVIGDVVRVRDMGLA